jgi:very-short-patch-repair endonuclease
MHGHPELTIHRSRDFDATRAVNRNAILVTNPLRTLVDLAGTAMPRQLTEAVDGALAKRLVTTAGLEAEIERLSRRGRDGVAILRRHLLDRGFIGAPAPSVLESHLGRLIRRIDLPLPQVEVRIGEENHYRLDLAWAAILLAVEVDGYAWHFSPGHMERDVSRRNELAQAGWTVLVFTWHQVVKEPDHVGQQIATAYRRLAHAA